MNKFKPGDQIYYVSSFDEEKHYGIVVDDATVLQDPVQGRVLMLHRADGSDVVWAKWEDGFLGWMWAKGVQSDHIAVERKLPEWW
jgi:hypothetical protein